MAQHVPFVIEPQNKQQIAFHLRLTPQLLEALVRSQEESEPVSIQFGQRDSENVRQRAWPEDLQIALCLAAKEGS